MPMVRKMRNRQKSGFKRFYILVVYAVYMLYYIADMRTSENVVVKQTASRSSVHMYLIALIGTLAIYMVMRMLLKGSFNLLRINTPLIYITLWGTVVDLFNGASFWSIAVHLGLLVLWILVIYFANNIIVDDKSYNLLLLFEFCIWVVTVYFFVEAFTNFADYRGEYEGVVLNISYNILVLLPFLFQIKNKLIKYVSIIISCGLIIVSMKRGAIVALILMLAVYYYMLVKSGKIKRLSISKILLVIGFFVVAFLIVDEMSNNYLSSRFSIESLASGSNRDLLYSMAINDIKNRSFVELLIGKGSGSSLAIVGSGVHNEVLEMLFSYGIIGLGIYLWFVIRGISILRRLLKDHNEVSAIYAVTLIYIVFVGVVGTALFAHYTFHIMASIGVSSGYLRRELEKQ